MNVIKGGKTAKQSFDEKELLNWVQDVTPRYSALIEETAKTDKDLAKLMIMAMDSFMANQFKLQR